MEIKPQDAAKAILELTQKLASISGELPEDLLMQITSSVSDGEVSMVRTDSGEIGWLSQDGTTWNPVNVLPI